MCDSGLSPRSPCRFPAGEDREFHRFDERRSYRTAYTAEKARADGRGGESAGLVRAADPAKALERCSHEVANAEP